MSDLGEASTDATSPLPDSRERLAAEGSGQQAEYVDSARVRAVRVPARLPMACQSLSPAHFFGRFISMKSAASPG